MEFCINFNSTLMYFEESCTEYCDEIIWILQESELNRLTMRYTSPQIRHREVMVNIIRSIGEYEELRRLTIHLAVYLMDAFMDNHNITDNRLNLVALSCVLLASKIEENEPNVPSLSRMNELVRNQYPVSDFNVIEVLLLKFFDWQLIIPTAATFVEYWLTNIVGIVDFVPSVNEQQFSERRSRAIELVLEFLDITLTDIKMTNVRPSMLASACIAAARSSLPVLVMWNENMMELTSYPLREIECLTRELMNWRACLIAKETVCRKRCALDSGYMSDLNESNIIDIAYNEYCENIEQDDLSIECDTEDTDDEVILSFKSKRAR
ncbi:cyclin-J isoform X2 [Toxorhynchites rutilus septentrionalis]|nr:cyclin-J isoform X2 [Toxorhynchites rutilus septentrionalis]